MVVISVEDIVIYCIAVLSCGTGRGRGSNRSMVLVRFRNREENAWIQSNLYLFSTSLILPAVIVLPVTKKCSTP